MTEAERIAIYTALGMITGGVFTTLLNAWINRKNSFFQSLSHAANALNITSDELAEALVAAKGLRQEIHDKDRKIEELEKNYKTLKTITRKLYQIMQDRRIDTDLSDEELDMLFDTQPIILLREKSKRKRESE